MQVKFLLRPLHHATAMKHSVTKNISIMKLSFKLENIKGLWVLIYWRDSKGSITKKDLKIYEASDNYMVVGAIDATHANSILETLNK